MNRDFVLGSLVVWALLSSTPALATPTYAIRSGHACNTCHIEPIGWKDPPDLSARKCTLDCRACHVSVAGGGLRNSMGRFYGAEMLATFGSRPSAGTDPEKYRNEGTESSVGRYRLWEGFSGWDREGATVHTEIPDRYGTIESDPRFQMGIDFRALGFFPSDGSASVFPMQAEIYGAGRPVPGWLLYAAAGLQGRRKRTIANLDAGAQDFTDYVTVREVFVQRDDLPWNGYARVGRFTKPYGWRIPDHTALTRRDLEQDQFAQVFGIETGLNPNYPWANLAVFYQGWDAWPGDQQASALGFAATGGVRELGWQGGVSLEYLHFTDNNRDQFTVGPQWGVNLYPVTYLGEANLRVSDRPGTSDVVDLGLYLFHKVEVLVYRGVSPFVRYDWADPNVQIRGDHRQRFTAGIDWTLHRTTQLGVQYRLNFLGKDLGTRDLLVLLHLFR